MAMETRKLQKVGGGTYTVSIPKSWADSHGLEVGETIHIYTHHDGSIVLRSARKDGGELDEVQVEIEGQEPEHVSSTLRSLHVIGFETVTLVPEHRFTEEQRRAARAIKQHFVGTEILVESEGEITIQNLLDTADISIRQSVVQLKFIVLSINRAAIQALLDDRSPGAARIEDQVEEADRMLDMITRHFNRAMISLEEVDLLGLSRPELFDYYATALELQRIAHLNAAMATMTVHDPTSLSAEVSETFLSAADVVHDFVDDAIFAVLGSDGLRNAHQTLDQQTMAIEQLVSIESELEDATNDVALSKAFENLLLMADHGRRIVDVAIVSAIRSEYL